MTNIAFHKKKSIDCTQYNKDKDKDKEQKQSMKKVEKQQELEK